MVVSESSRIFILSKKVNIGGSFIGEICIANVVENVSIPPLIVLPSSTICIVIGIMPKTLSTGFIVTNPNCVVIGLAMANERVNRYHSPEGYEIIYKFNSYYIYDPVENNDFWFVQGKD